MDGELSTMGLATLSGFQVLAEVVQKLDIEFHQPFRGHHILAVQHVHSSMAPLVDALLLGGADPDELTVVSKAYSSKPRALAAVRQRGVRVVEADEMADPCHSYEIELREAVAGLLDRAAESGRPLLVLDEGAVASRGLRPRPDLAGRTRLVEQTTRGARWDEQAGLQFTVVDVARSAAKAEFEAPLVARAMVDGLLIALADLDLQPRRVGLVGYGRMGLRLARRLSRHFEVAVTDTASDNVRRAQADGFKVGLLADLAGEAELLIGCTGSAIVDERSLEGFKASLILANGASSDIEFALWGRRKPDSIVHSRAGGSAKRPWDNHYTLGSTVRHTLLAGGFPVNFYHPAEPITPQEFQLTRALMLAGAVQAVAESRPGVTPLADAAQHLVVAAYERAMATPGDRQ